MELSKKIMLIDGLQLDKRYAGIFLTRATDIAYRIKHEIDYGDVSIWIYESPEMILCIIIGDEHTESIINWFHKVHEIANGSSMIAGILSNKRLQPSKSDNYFFRLQIDAMQFKALTRYIEKNKLFCLFLPHSNELCILTDGHNGLNFRNYFKNILPSPLTGFVLRSVIKKRKSNKKLSKFYDPIGAQIGEILNRYPVALKKLIQDTANSWKNILHTEPPPEIQGIEDSINNEIIKIKSYIDKLQDVEVDIYIKRALLRQIDSTLFSFKEISRSYANFKDHLREYDDPINPWNYPTSYLELATPLVLRAAKSYIDELTERAGISDQFEIIPIFSEDYAAYPLIHPGLLATENRITKIISLPRETKLRIGAFPILGHEIGHFVLDKNHVVISEIISDLLSEKYKMSFHGAFNDLDKIYKNGELQKVISLDRLEQCEIMKNRILEI